MLCSSTPVLVLGGTQAIAATLQQLCRPSHAYVQLFHTWQIYWYAPAGRRQNNLTSCDTTSDAMHGAAHNDILMLYSLLLWMTADSRMPQTSAMARNHVAAASSSISECFRFRLACCSGAGLGLDSAGCACCSAPPAAEFGELLATTSALPASSWTLSGG